MENQKSSGFFGKLFASKPKDCCTVQIEEIKDDAIDLKASNAAEAPTVAKSKKTSSNGSDESSGCCSA